MVVCPPLNLENFLYIRAFDVLSSPEAVNSNHLVQKQFYHAWNKTWCKLWSLKSLI